MDIFPNRSQICWVIHNFVIEFICLVFPEVESDADAAISCKMIINKIVPFAQLNYFIDT